MSYLHARLREPSSWLGLLTIALALAAVRLGVRHVATLPAGLAGFLSAAIPDPVIRAGFDRLIGRFAEALWAGLAASRPRGFPSPDAPSKEEPAMPLDLVSLDAWSRKAAGDAAAAGAKAAGQSLTAAIGAGVPGVSSDVQAVVQAGWNAVHDAAAGRFDVATDAVPFVTALARLAADLETKPAPLQLRGAAASL